MSELDFSFLRVNQFFVSMCATFCGEQEPFGLILLHVLGANVIIFSHSLFKGCCSQRYTPALTILFYSDECKLTESAAVVRWYYFKYCRAL